jgi:hypothetical protein
VGTACRIRELISSGALDDIAGATVASTARACESAPGVWTLAFGHHEDRTPTHGYEATREAAMAAFVKSWRRE